MRAVEVEQTVKVFSPKHNEVQQSIKFLIECGKFAGDSVHSHPEKNTNKWFAVYLFSQLSTPIISHTLLSPIISNSRHLFTYQ